MDYQHADVQRINQTNGSRTQYRNPTSCHRKVLVVLNICLHVAHNQDCIDLVNNYMARQWSSEEATINS